MKKCLIMIMLTAVLLYFMPVDVAAANCKTLLGNPADSESVAWLLNKILGYIQVLGPILVIILSSIDFAKVIMKSDDEAMAKAQRKLVIRLILAASLFFLPVLVKVLLATFGLTSDPTCGIG